MITEDKIKEYRNDYSLIAGEHYLVKPKQASLGLSKFVFNRAQKYLWSLLLEDLKKGIPVRWFIIKSRQLGCSTWIVLLFYWLISFFPNRNGLIVAQEELPAFELADKAKLVFRTIAKELRPMVKTNNRHILYFANPDDDGDLGLESQILVKSADSDALGASYTLHMALLSEFALWESEKGLDVKERLATALQTVPEEAGTFVFIETTARGEGDCKEMWDDPDFEYRRIFISWIADDNYRREVNPAEYFILVDDDSHKYGDETEVAKLIEFELNKWYPELHHLSEPFKSQTIQHEIMCRLSWRRYMINNKCQGDKAIFQREYPLTAEEAFSGTGKNVFSQNKLKDIKNYLEVNSPKFERYRFDEIEKKFGLSRYGPLRIYLRPEKQWKYVLGVDPAQGNEGGDASGLIILRVPDLIQCVSFEEIIDPDEFSEMIYQLYLLYNQAFTGVEVNDKGGYLVVNNLKKFGVRNQYRREVLDSTTYKKTQEKYGWFSNNTNKPTMVSDMRDVLKHASRTIQDLDVVKQLMKYQELPNGHMKAIDGKDHLADAYMIAIEMSKYVHKGSYTQSTGIPKYSLKWWESLIDKQNDFAVIGHNPRGSNANYL